MIVVKFYYKGADICVFETGLPMTRANKLAVRELLCLQNHEKINFPENWDKWEIEDE